MKKIILLSLLFLAACNSEAPKKKVETKKSYPKYDFSKNSNSVSAEDDFSDFKEMDDESCDTEEEIKEKLAKPKQEAFKLQGGDTGCDPSELENKN